jgi:hypothetical protein
VSHILVDLRPRSALGHRDRDESYPPGAPTDQDSHLADGEEEF